MGTIEQVHTRREMGEQDTLPRPAPLSNFFVIQRAFNFDFIRCTIIAPTDLTSSTQTPTAHGGGGWWETASFAAAEFFLPGLRGLALLA